MIESGLVKQGLVKVGLVSALQNWAARYFRRNKGDDDYATIPEVTLTGDFSLSFSSSSLPGSYLGSKASSSFRVVTFGTNLIIGVGGVDTATFDASTIDLSSLQEFVVVRVGSVFTCSIGGVDLVQTGGSGSSAPVSIDSICSPWGQGTAVPYLSGILANLKIYDNGTLIRNYPLNEPKGTPVIYDIIGGNNGTIVNGDDEDKGLFTKQANGDWLGSNLDVPPWDSVDQTLPVA